MNPGKRKAPEGSGADADTKRHQPGCYTKPLPLRARHLPPECWWLRSQPWCEQHLERLAGAWDRVYGEVAA